MAEHFVIMKTAYTLDALYVVLILIYNGLANILVYVYIISLIMRVYLYLFYTHIPYFILH